MYCTFPASTASCRAGSHRASRVERCRRVRERVAMTCSFEEGARNVEVVVSIWRPGCSQICVGSQWPFLGLRPSPRLSSRHATRSRRCNAASLLLAKNRKSSMYGSNRAPRHRELRRYHREGVGRVGCWFVARRGLCPVGLGSGSRKCGIKTSVSRQK